MRWFKHNLKSSFFAIFASGTPVAPPESVPAVSVDDIREAMLALIGETDDQRFAHVARRIRSAMGAIALWYLRADLMGPLAGRDGEAQAREKLQGITDMFEHLLPQGLKSRPSPLAAASSSDRGAVAN